MYAPRYGAGVPSYFDIIIMPFIDLTEEEGAFVDLTEEEGAFVDFIIIFIAIIRLVDFVDL
jgi:hypothetical protein